MKTGVAATLLCLMAITGCASTVKSPPRTQAEPAVESLLPAPDANGEPFAGLWLVDSSSGETVVHGIVAGPAALAGLKGGDHVVRIDGMDIDAASAHAIIQSSTPGTRLELEIFRDAAPMTITLIIADRARWSGPSAFVSAVPIAQPGVDETSPDHPINEYLLVAPQVQPIVARIERMFAELARSDSGYHKLPLIRSAMMQPESMPDWQDALTEQLRPFQNERDSAIPVLCNTLALSCPESLESTHTRTPSLATFTQIVSDANQAVRNVFDAAQANRAQAYADLHYLMKTTAADRTLIAQPGVIRGIQAMQLSMQVDLAPLLETAHQLLANAAQLPETPAGLRQPYEELDGMVEGAIVDYCSNRRRLHRDWRARAQSLSNGFTLRGDRPRRR